MVTAKKAIDKKSNAGTTARNKNAIEDVANSNALALSAKNNLFSDPRKNLTSFGNVSWSKKTLGTLGQMAGKISSPSTKGCAARGNIVRADTAAVRLVKPVDKKPGDPKRLGDHACTVIDSGGNYGNIHMNETTGRILYNTIPLGDCFVVAKTPGMFYNEADGRYNISVAVERNETFETTFAPWAEDPNIPHARINPTNVTHFPHIVETIKKPGRRVDAIGMVFDFNYTQGKGADEETQRAKSRCTFTMLGKYCGLFYIKVRVWGEQAIELANKYENPEDGTITAFLKNAGVVERIVGEETTIELTNEYNTLTLFYDTDDPRLLESKVNVADHDGVELAQLTSDVVRDGPRFTEEVFLYNDRIETHKIVANKYRAGANAAAASAQASPAQKFKPKVPFAKKNVNDDDDDDDDDDDFAPPLRKSSKKNSSLDNTLGESESERTNVETHRRSPKKGSPKENPIVLDDDEGDAMHAEIASPIKPPSKATKTFKFPQKAKPAARTTPKTKLAKDAVTVGNDDDEKDEDEDEDLSRIQRRSKRTKAN